MTFTDNVRCEAERSELGLKGLEIAFLVKLLIKMCRSLERFETRIEMPVSLVISLSCGLLEKIINGNEFSDIPCISVSNEFNKSHIILHNYN